MTTTTATMHDEAAFVRRAAELNGLSVETVYGILHDLEDAAVRSGREWHRDSAAPDGPIMLGIEEAYFLAYTAEQVKVGMKAGVENMLTV